MKHNIRIINVITSSTAELIYIMVTLCRHHCIQTFEDPSVIQTDCDDHLKFYFTSQQIKHL